MNDDEQHEDNNNNDNAIKYPESNKENILDLAEKNYESLTDILANNAINTYIHSSSDLKLSSTFSRPSNRGNTYRIEEQGSFHNSKDDVAE